MADPLVSGTVHWLGTGLSTGRGGLSALAGDRTVLWGRTRDRAAQCLERLCLRGLDVRGLGSDDLAAALRPGDVVVSMLPAAEHPGLLKICLDRGAHFACTSYTTDTLAELAAGAEVTVLTEAGLDPGIDHLLAHRLVAAARRTVGEHAEQVDFASYCGGIPAEPNDFRYRFSWAPLGVLTALAAPARHIEAGVEVRTPYPFEAVGPLSIAGETFEVYPNRDSVPFVEQYGLPAGWTPRGFVRGTLRLAGWRDAWRDVFATVKAGDPDAIAALARQLAAMYPTGPGDLDRVLLTVALSVDGWHGEYVLDLVGDGTESAMARCVSLTAAVGVNRILSGRAAPGLARAASTATEADEWLAFLHGHGLHFEFHERR
jgi:saccharopine dehydrogenase (NADP+, L-glutamate forming)